MTESNIMFSTLSVTSFLVFGLASCTLVNVARNKTVTMSSYYDDPLRPGSEPQAPGSNAVNGINDGQWYNGSCACTKNEQDPWLLLDLESSYTVVAILIVNRADCCPERLKNLHFTFGPSEVNMTEIYHYSGTVGAVLNVTFDTPHTGQYLRISMDSYNYLTICGVEVYEIGDPVNGSWTDWGNWTTCSPTCGNGTESRARSCENPAPRYGGEDCEGDAEETRTCEVPECPVDGGWTEFSNWTACSHSCGIGISTRTRSCTEPIPSGGGLYCEGAATDSMVCHTEECPPVEETTNNIDLCEPNEFPENCEDIRLSNPEAASDIYVIYPLNSEVEFEVFCEFLDDKSYLYLSRTAIESITTAELRQLYSRRDHVLIRLLNASNVQSSLEVSQLSSFRYQYALSFQISNFERHSRPLNHNVSSYLYVGFQPSEAAPYTDPAKLPLNPFFGYRANGADVLFLNLDQRPKSFVAFFPDHDAFISSQYYTGWSKEMPTIISWNPWFEYTQPVATARYLPSEYFMDYELGFGGNDGSANSNDGELLRGILGATVGFAYAANFNVAFGKTVTMSSTHSDGPGHYAVDGIRGGFWDQGCASTDRQKNPWMLIDLGGDYMVSEVYLRNRNDCCEDRLSHVHIEIGKLEDNLTKIVYYPVRVEDEITFTLESVSFGRFVKIWLEKTEYLTICEVEIYCNEANSNFTDWSEWGMCTQSCGNGTAFRGRSCLESYCCGALNETTECNTHACPGENLKEQLDQGPTAHRLAQSSCAYEPRDCRDIDTAWSGVYHVTPAGTFTGTDVYCDMTTDGGGLTVFQRRTDNSVDFDRNWTDYLKGFGDALGSHWLGLRWIKTIVLQGEYELRIDIEDLEGTKRYASYEFFDIGSSLNQYQLTVDGYSGGAGDALSNNSGSPFSSNDRDWTFKNCASLLKGAWWYIGCHDSHLNSQYQDTNQSRFYWDQYPLKKSEIKIRRI